MVLALLAALILAALASIVVLRRRSFGPNGFWTFACLAIFASATCGFLVSEVPALLPLRFAFGMLYPALLLAGALAFLARPPPAWLLAGAIAVGTGRALVAMAGRPEAASWIGAATEPLPTLLAAALLFPCVRRPGASLPERALAPALLVMGLVDGASAWASSPGAALPSPLLGAWALAIPMLLAVQIAATSRRVQESLKRARDDLERRVQQRTAELARSVSDLEQLVAERGAAERALRESEERYRTVSELSSDYSFAFRIDREGSIVHEWITDAVQRVTGYAGHELEGHRWFDLVHPDDRVRAASQLQEVLAGTVHDTVVRIITRSGETRFLAVRFGARHLEDDGSGRVVGAAQDITERVVAESERRRLEQHVQEVQRLESLGVLAGGIAHDFNNALTVIGGNSDIALRELPEGDPLRPRIERIRAAAEYASELTAQMLTYSGRVSVKLRPVDLSRLSRDLLDLLRASVGHKCTLDFDLAEDLPPVYADATQMRQVLLNLAANASDALGEEGGRICIRTRAVRAGASELGGAFGAANPSPGEYVALEIIDDGPGMEPGVLARVFEPFFTTKASGRGLGLAGVLGIVSAHGGVIAPDSRPGHGTAFRVMLPVSPHPAEVAERSGGRAPAALEPAAGGVLVVDDDVWVLEVAQEFLRRAGLQVLAARGGREALEILRARASEIDAVVLDLVMPDMPGEEVLDEVRRLRPDLPVIIASGYGKDLTAERLFARGVSGIVFKPYEPEDLIERIRSVLPASPG